MGSKTPTPQCPGAPDSRLLKILEQKSLRPGESGKKPIPSAKGLNVVKPDDAHT